MDLIERVARAICEADQGQWRNADETPAPGIPRDYDFDKLNNRWRYLAKAAIEASGIERSVEALTKCRDRFDEYVKMHRAKLLPAHHPDEFYQNARTTHNTEVQEKIDRNQEMVELCDETLSLIKGVEK